MRVVKNSKAALEARQTRPCVVRLHKVNTNQLIYPPPSNRRSYTTKITRSSPKVSEQQQKQIMNEKVFRGPLKKRPINDGGNQKSSNATPNAASRNKMKATPKRSEPVEETPPPTIAASRSRRSIKPNPKYASEDIVTPKTIRATTTVPNSASAKRGGFAGSQANNLGGKQKIAQPQYESSSEDFFNKDTSEEDSALDDDDGRGDDDVKMQDKPYEILDSSDSDIEQLIKAAQPKKRVGRPKKNTDSSTMVSKAPEHESSINIKSTPSQLQQMRRSLANTQTNSNPRTPATPSSVTLKRKFPAVDNSDSISRKRVLLAPGGVRQLKDAAAQSPERQQTVELPTRKSMPVGLTVTRVKLPTEGAGGGGGGNSQQSTAQEQRRILMAKTLARTGTTMTKSSSSSATNKSVQSNSAPIQNEQRSSNASTVQRSVAASRAMAVAAKGGRSSSPITTAATAATTRQTKESAKKIIMEDLTDDDPVSAAATPEDFDSMPTFTIVNINDIINKKGDALISRSSSPPPQTTPQTKSPGQNAKVQRTGEENTNNNNQKLPLAPAGANKPGMRRRGPASKVLAEKQQTEKQQQQQQVVANNTRQGQQKKSTPTILNHTLKQQQQQQTRPVRGAAQKSPEKPAPRILNSMVAKKTEPIKPVIANLDDSADESLPLSMDDDEDDDDTEDDSSAAEQPPRRQYNSKSKTAGKSATPAAKENSSALTNCTNNNNNNNNSSSNKLSMLKSSPEKVIIQRQGDKIIKKVTCFENWYVLSVIDEKPPQPARNQLDMPLVKLANLTEDIALPSDNWTVKVTLYELSPSTLANTALITYTGDLGAHNIAEEDRAKYQPSCVMFRRSVTERQLVRLPYDRAVIFKNKTFFTNISGKNVRLVGAPSKISSQEDVEILLEIVNDLTLESTFVEPATMTQ